MAVRWIRRAHAPGLYCLPHRRLLHHQSRHVPDQRHCITAPTRPPPPPRTRLCPADEPLTEACFQARPLPFVGQQTIVYANGSRLPIPSKYAYANGSVAAITADGQRPVGASWALNPLPDGTQPGSTATGRTEFPSPCPEDHHPTADGGGPWPPPGLCSGERPFGVSVVDVLRVPEETRPGAYVLGWRWDVEETAQVWSSCSDITVVG